MKYSQTDNFNSEGISLMTPLFCLWKLLKLVFMQEKLRCNWNTFIYRIRYFYSHTFFNPRFKNTISSSDCVKQQVHAKCEKHKIVRTISFLKIRRRRFLKYMKWPWWNCNITTKQIKSVKEITVYWSSSWSAVLKEKASIELDGNMTIIKEPIYRLQHPNLSLYFHWRQWKVSLQYSIHVRN